MPHLLSLCRLNPGGDITGHKKALQLKWLGLCVWCLFFVGEICRGHSKSHYTGFNVRFSLNIEPIFIHFPCIARKHPRDGYKGDKYGAQVQSQWFRYDSRTYVPSFICRHSTISPIILSLRTPRSTVCHIHLSPGYVYLVHLFYPPHIFLY